LIKQSKIFFLFFLLNTCFVHVFAQRSLNENRFFFVKLGKGVSYGGLGLNTEFRERRVGGYFNFGYAPENEVQSVKISSSYNVGGGLNYYFLSSESSVKPKLGIYYGWLQNYYNSLIGTTVYNPSVYGAALVTGFDFGEKIVFFDLNLVFDSGFLIYNKESHPFYSSNFYVSTSFGLGINLFELNRALKRQIHIKKIKAKNIETSIENEHKNINQEQEAVEEKCFGLDNVVASISKGLCYENIVYQQVATNKYVVIKFERNIIDYNGTNNFKVEDDLFAHAYLVENVKTDNFCHVLDKTNKITEAKQGTITLYVKENAITETYKISLMLKNVAFSSNDKNISNEQIFDEIVICNLEY